MLISWLLSRSLFSGEDFPFEYYVFEGGKKKHHHIEAVETMTRTMVMNGNYPISPYVRRKIKNQKNIKKKSNQKIK